MANIRLAPVGTPARVGERLTAESFWQRCKAAPSAEPLNRKNEKFGRRVRRCTRGRVAARDLRFAGADPRDLSSTRAAPTIGAGEAASTSAGGEPRQGGTH